MTELMNFKENWEKYGIELFPDVILGRFLRESNAIEGIHRDPSLEELTATRRFMQLFRISAKSVAELQAIYQPGRPIRQALGMNVRVGNYIAPEGGANIPKRLRAICSRANRGENPWKVHVLFETLHPFLDGNGRTGRAIWAWMMHSQGKKPFELGFLHKFYYQTLENVGR